MLPGYDRPRILSLLHTSMNILHLVEGLECLQDAPRHLLDHWSGQDHTTSFLTQMVIEIFEDEQSTSVLSIIDGIL